MSNQSRCLLTPSPISPNGDQSLASRLLGGRDVVGVSYRPLLEQRQGLRAVRYCVLLRFSHPANVASNPSGWKIGSHPKFFGPRGGTILPGQRPSNVTGSV